MMEGKPPGPDFWGAAGWFAIAWFYGILGRIAWHLNLTRKGHRKLWSKELLLEMPMAAFCGMAAFGLLDFFGIDGTARAGIASIIAYLGPGAIEEACWKLLDRYASRPGQLDNKERDE